MNIENKTFRMLRIFIILLLAISFSACEQTNKPLDPRKRYVQFLMGHVDSEGRSVYVDRPLTPMERDTLILLLDRSRVAWIQDTSGNIYMDMQRESDGMAYVGMILRKLENK
jgi:hypothetical protein